MKQNSSFTPGPWHLHSDGKQLLVIARGPIISGCVACISTDWAHADQNAEQQSNAKLIAAAPELLAALKSVHREFEARERQFGSENPNVEPWHSVIAAIAKAEGRQ